VKYTSFPNCEARTAAWLSGFQRARAALVSLGIDNLPVTPPNNQVDATTINYKPPDTDGVIPTEVPAPTLSVITPANGGDGRPSSGNHSDDDEFVTVYSDEEDGRPVPDTTPAAAVESSVTDSDIVRSFQPEDFDPRDAGASVVTLDYVTEALTDVGDAAVKAQLAQKLSDMCGLPKDGAVDDDIDDSDGTSCPEVVHDYIDVPVGDGSVQPMYIATVIAMLSTDPTASSDRCLRIKQAAAGFLTNKDLICNDSSISVNVDCAWNFDESLWFGRVMYLGTKKGEHGVIPVAAPVSLIGERPGSIVVGCQYYERLRDDEAEAVRRDHSLPQTAKYLYRFGHSEFSSKTCGFCCWSRVQLHYVFSQSNVLIVHADSVESVIRRVAMTMVVGGSDPVFEVPADEYDLCIATVNVPGALPTASSAKKHVKAARSTAAATSSKSKARTAGSLRSGRTTAATRQAKTSTNSVKRQGGSHANGSVSRPKSKRAK